MVRGVTYPLGYERIAQNGYYYVKTKEGWRLKHHVIAEQNLDRRIDTRIETVRFKDRNRKNFDPDNIIVEPKKGLSKADKIELIKARIEELQAQLAEEDEEEEEDEAV